MFDTLISILKTAGRSAKEIKIWPSEVLVYSVLLTILKRLRSV